VIEECRVKDTRHGLGSIENFQPGLQPNSEQKDDEMHVTQLLPMRCKLMLC